MYMYIHLITTLRFDFSFNDKNFPRFKEKILHFQHSIKEWELNQWDFPHSRIAHPLCQESLHDFSHHHQHEQQWKFDGVIVSTTIL